jgi:hypothetical protein
MRKIAIAIGIMACGALIFASAGAGTSASSARASHKQVLFVTLVPTSVFWVDNDPTNTSAGDIAGSTGPVRRHGHKIGSYSLACTLVSANRAQCQATLKLRHRGKIQLSGEFRLNAHHNRLAIVGGTGRFRRARGAARLKAFKAPNGNDGQHIRLTIIR